MKKRLAGIAALAALIATPALAADLSRPIYTKAPPPPPPAFSWSGCYLGGHVGGAWARTRVTDVGNGAAAFATAGVPGQEFDSDTSGVIGGGQVGCNWQSNNFVFGLEGDVGYLGIRGSVLDPGTTSNTMVGIDN